MAHIKLPEGFPGIRGPLMFSPATAKPLRELAEILMRGPNTLTPAEREIIGTYVSSQNDCYYCQTCHGSTAAHHLGGNFQLIDEIKRDFETTAISEKLKALLVIAGKVQQSGKQVRPEDIERASARCDGHGNPRYRFDRRVVLHVQSLCGWACHLGAKRPRSLSRYRRNDREGRLFATGGRKADWH
jgi:AhpD family alkylhydroperoxidase